jgi:NADH-quinone oxidoreductase subunit I
MSPVYRGQHMLKRDEQGRENCTAFVDMCVVMSRWGDYNESEERKADEKHLYREKICLDIWDKYVALYFVVYVRRACPRCDLFDYSVLVLVMKEKIYFWKDRLVMPLDMAIKMLN